MNNINEIKEAIGIICQDILTTANSVLDKGSLPDKIHYENESISDYLTQFEMLKFTEKMLVKHKIDARNFLNNYAMDLPIRYLACYILFHGGELKFEIKEDKNDNKNS